MKTQSIVETLHGQVYMKKLCRHWAHRVEVKINDNDALVQLPFGSCRIEVDKETMTFDVAVSNASNVERAEKFVASHLTQMANRDEPQVVWQRQETAA